MGGVPWGLRGGGLKMGVGGSPNRGWGHLDPNGDPKPYGDFSTAVSARSWGAGGGGEGSQNGGGGPKMEGGLKMEGGSQNRRWGHLDPNGDPKILWGFQHRGQRHVMVGGGRIPKRGWGSQNGGGGLKMGGGVTLIPMENPKSYGDFSTAVSAGSWGEGGGGGV